MSLLPIAALALTTLIVAAWALRARRQRERFRAILDFSPNGILILGRGERIIWHNKSATKLLHCDAKDLRHSQVNRWLPMLNTLPEPLERQETLALNINEERHHVEITRLPDVSRRTAVLLIHPDPFPTASDDAMERLKRSQYFAQIGTWDWDIGTDRLYWSEAIYGMFGYQLDEITPTYQLFCDSVHPDDREKVNIGEKRCMETGLNLDQEYRVVWPDGSVRWLRETGNVVKDELGRPLKMMGVVRDITEDKQTTRALEHLAHRDPLTKLPNRLLLERRLGKALARARTHQTRVALIFIDLNDFKRINDQHGHAVGDQILISVAERLRSAVRASDMIARLGGDEFVVLMEDLSSELRLGDEAHSICEKLFVELAPHTTVNERQHRVGASLGVAFYPDHALTLDKLIHAADLAMYAAKRSGNNQYRLGGDLTTHAH